MSISHLQLLMTAQEYILSSLTELSTPIVLGDIGDATTEEAIYAKVMSKKFRKVKADEDAQRITKEAIHTAVATNSPLKLNVIFGGNKLWRFEESPEIDWSEVFTTIYLSQWMKSIASVYKPGAYLEYYSEDVVLENMNNLPKSETNQYSDTFRSMLDWMRQYTPEGVTVAYKRYGDEYASEADYLAELEIAKAKVLKELGGKLPELSEKQIRATVLNVRLKPGQADDSLWQEKAELIHKSIERTETMERYISDASFVPACPTQFPGCITTGSTKKSYAKFWVAVGALEKSGDSYSQIVLTPNQLESADFEWEDINLTGLEGKNFKRIRVLG
jgi:hypothetical protein